MRRFKAVTILTLLLSIISCSDSSQSLRKSEEVSVGVEHSEKYDILSANPVKIQRGENAEFKIKFKEEYDFLACGSNCEYQDEKIILTQVQFSQTIKVETKNKMRKGIEVINDNNYGYVNVTEEADHIIIECNPIGNNHFISWTLEKDLSSVMPFSYERKLVLDKTSTIKLYANYQISDEYMVIYHGNGGSTKSGDEEVYYPHILNNHLRANTVQGSKCFYQDGYILDSWNTSKDGTGERIGLGSRVTVYKDKVVDLYAIWIKESNTEDFDFTLSDDMSEYYLSKCKSEDERVVIPNNYLGKPVTKLLSRSIENLEIKELFINENCQEIEENTILNCSNLKDIHMFDSLKSFNNVEINNKFNTLYINGNTNPRFSGTTYQAIFADKVDRLVLKQGQKKILFIGNSNTLYSIDGEMVANHFNMNVLSMGVQADIGIKFEIDVIKKYCKNDDNILVFCPEFNSIGNNLYITDRVLYACENNWDMLTAFNFSDKTATNIFNAYNSYQEKKKAMEEDMTYWQDGSNISVFGTSKYFQTERREKDWYSSKIELDKMFYKEGGAKWLNDLTYELNNSKLYFSCPSFNINSIDDKTFLFNEYEDSIISSINFPMISHFSDYGFTGEAFYNDNYHLIYDYAVIRTSTLIQDLSKVLS